MIGLPLPDAVAVGLAVVLNVGVLIHWIANRRG